MQKDALNNVHITDEQVLITPDQLKAAFPLSAAQEAQIEHSRQTISDIIAGRDPRLLVVCGPCSIHDPETAIEYAHRFKALAEEVSDSLYLVMRVYFEKPRTTVGWKGLINDPHMDGSFDVEAGLKIARRLLVELVSMGLPLATEALDPNSPQYLGDLFSWSAIGARTTESQTHREMASGLSMPVGFKNGTDGSLATAINAMRAAAMPHRFVGINQAGQVCLLQTQGNPDGHVILRGSAAMGPAGLAGRSPAAISHAVIPAARAVSRHALRAPRARLHFHETRMRGGASSPFQKKSGPRLRKAIATINEFHYH